MRPWLFALVLVTSAVAGVWSNLLLFRIFQPPDSSAAFMGGLWITSPYLAASGCALLRRRHTAVLAVLLTSLIVAGVVGVWMLDATVTQQEVAAQNQRDAVLPGEDPNRGAAAQRKVGADMGVAVGGVFSILVAAVLPPVQLLAVLVPVVITSVVAAVVRACRGAKVEVPISGDVARGGG